jgi:nitrogen fixation protein FixH
MRIAALAPTRTTGLRGHHVLAGFLAFFGVVLAVNGAMIYSAISTHTGLVAIEPYRKGLRYNDRIAAGERQDRLGWTVALDVRLDGTVLLRLSETDGQPVRNLKISAVLGRPSTNQHDISLTLVEKEAGAYAAVIPPLAEGSWLFTFDAAYGDPTQPVFRARRRLWLKP